MRSGILLTEPGVTLETFRFALRGRFEASTDGADQLARDTRPVNYPG